tara:strand:+ start:8531 stop:8893 length:363 start_codon:yes stop_codon:yes gene_type:complete
MTKRPTITKEVIWAAADQLEARGVYPSFAAIRKVAGGGSYTTIGAAMAERKRLPRAVIEGGAIPIPKRLSERFGTLGEEVWAAAVAHAHDRWRHRVEELEEALRAAEAQIAQHDSSRIAD